MNIIYDINILDILKIKNNRTPTLIKNGVYFFDNLKKWNENYIIDTYGNLNCNYSYHARPVRSNLQTTYVNYFNNLNNNTYTFTRTKYLENNTDFIKDFTFPNPFFCKENIDKHIFYSGPKNTGALPHSHGSAINFMIFGKKKWIFFDTKTSIGKRLEQYYYTKYPKDIKYDEWYENEYEKLKKIVPLIECTQDSNDVVFIPKDYNHSVLNLEKTMGIVIELF